jgi:hypothetical protein
MWRSLVGQGLCLALLVACGEEDPAADDDSSDVSDDTGGAVAFEGDEPGECTDGADNDLDGLFDCSDPDCAPSPDCQDAGGPNVEPSQPMVDITPSDATSADDLTCSITLESEDPEGEPVVYLYSWEIDGVESGITSSTVMSRFTQGSETWSCVVVATDGEMDSPPAFAELTLPRDNTPPTTPEIEISPEEPIPLDDLVCNITVDSTDAEADEITYTWAWDVDGTDAGISEDTVGGDITEAGDVWTCMVTPSDGYESGEPATASVEIPTCYGSALEFNGVDDVVTIPASSSFAWSEAVTVEAWVRWDGESGTNDQVIVDHGPEDDYSFTLSIAGQSTSDHPLCGDVSAGSVLFQAAGYSGEAKTCLESVSQLTAGAWAHVAVTFDGPDMYIFIDGVESVYGRTGSSLHDASAFDMTLGGRADEGSSFYGVIDEVRVSSSARYIADFTTEQAPEADSDTVLLYHMDEGFGSSLSDDSGNGLDASVDSAIWSAWSSCDAIGAR